MEPPGGIGEHEDYLSTSTEVQSMNCTHVACGNDLT